MLAASFLRWGGAEDGGRRVVMGEQDVGARVLLARATAAGGGLPLYQETQSCWEHSPHCSKAAWRRHT